MKSIFFHRNFNFIDQLTTGKSFSKTISDIV